MHNPVSDLIHFTSKAENSLRILKEFGNLKENAELIKQYSPYESKMKYKIETDLLLTSDETDSAGTIHALKFLARMRRLHSTDRVLNRIFYQHIPRGSTE